MNIDIEQLRKRCQQSNNELLEGNQYKYIDNGSNVLAVAHVDVSPVIKNHRNNFTIKDGIIYSPSLDDRLGVHIILDILPKLGVNVDVLLTTDEEIGQSTASLFQTEKSYNWMFQFDRRGTDVVMYDYETREARGHLEDFGFTIGRGSFSDICMLEGLGIVGFNFGTGYYDEHSLQCRCLSNHTVFMVRSFVEFYNQISNVRLDHNLKSYSEIIEDFFVASICCEYCLVETDRKNLYYDFKYDVTLCMDCKDFLGV